MITLKNIVLRRGAKVVLDSASVTLNPGEKIAIVGRNGAGKSSLFALLNGTLHEDGGDVFVPPQWRLAQVAQDMPETSQAATNFVVAGDLLLAAALAEVTAAEATEDYERMAHAYTALNDAGAHDAPARAQSLLLGLGFSTQQLNLPVNSFSGGWRMRLQLARALMCPSDLLLLDEPTNHLDLDALVWLETWLMRYEGTMLVISHDREFLDAVSNVTVHIEGAKLKRYGGNYSKFEDMRAEQMALMQTAFDKQQEKIAHLQKFIDRFKAKASKAKQAQSRVKALERMERVAPLLAEADFSFDFKEPANLPNPMLVLSEVACGYHDTKQPHRTTTIVQSVSKSVLAGQRIGILGANGQGKSTLIKTLTGNLPPLSGSIIEGKGLRIGYFAQQELDVLRVQDNPLDHMIALARTASANGSLSGQSTREQDLRGFLGGFNFSGDMVKQAVGSMSGGEKARLVLCMLVWQRPNLLVLDEPTNHLDLATREALSMALNGFEGSLLLVSHDRALLRAVCDEFWLVTQAKVDAFTGDLDDYQRFLLQEAKRAREMAKNSQTVPEPVVDSPTVAVRLADQPSSTVLSKNEMNRLSKRLQAVSTQLTALTQESERLTNELASTSTPEIHAKNGKRLTTLASEIAVLEDEWLTISASLEPLQPPGIPYA